MSTDVQRAVVGYIHRGVAVIPTVKKKPVHDDWQNLRLGEEDVPRHWSNGQNVGVLNGEPSGWRVCVDLDVPEALKIAGRILPPTLTSGRKSRPHAHWWLISPAVRTERFKDVDGTVLFELRSTGAQTLVEPSVHPSGERYAWHRESGLGMAHVEATELKRRLRELATAVLISRHLPKLRDETTGEGGGRHDYALALAGFLLRSGRLDEPTTLKVLKAAWDAKGWPSEREKREAHHDLEGIVRDTVENLAAGEPVVGGPTLEDLAPGVVRLLCKWWGWERGKAQEEPAPEEKEEERKPTQAEQLIHCTTGAEFFHTSEGDSYATIPIGGHQETHLIKSKGFRRWLVRAFFEKYERPPGAQALQDALGLLEARAQFDGVEREVHVRVAEHGGAIYIDLANDRWEVVEIRAGRWQVVSGEATPVRFRRPRGMLALPVPKRGGTVDELRRFVNVADEGSWRLLVAWLVQALRPTGPYPVLLLQGEQGSAKSTVERLLRALVDPSAAPLRTTPRNEHDLYIAATNAWVIALDNISNLQPWLSDGACRLSTGGGFSTRTLYENREQELFDATRPLVLNGIADVATRPDLLDRALIVPLPPIPEDERKPEGELWAAFEKARPSILGALFDALAGALGAVPSLRLERMPRMADFALWITAAEDALGWKSGAFMDAYTGNRSEATESALDADPVAGAVRTLMENRAEWSGTAAELWKVLGDLIDDDIRHTKSWPGAPNALSGRLKRLAPALRGVGIEYGDVRQPGTGKRLKSLKKIGEKDRHDRHDRHAAEKAPQNEGLECDSRVTTPGDGPAKTVTDKSPANRRIRDDGDSRDGDLQRDSKEQGSWQSDPMGHYRRGGTA